MLPGLVILFMIATVLLRRCDRILLNLSGANPVFRFRIEATLAFLLPLLLYLALPAATMNGDGLAYWVRVRSSDWHAKILPGHLLYIPFMSTLCWVVPGCPTDTVMRLTNQVAGAASVFMVFCSAGRLGLNRFGRWLAAMCVATSFGVWIQATDVETYALALVFVVSSIYAMTRCASDRTLGCTILLGFFNSLAALFHLATITLGLASVLLLMILYRDQYRKLATNLAAYFITTALAFGLPVCLIGFLSLELPSILSLLKWLKSSEHGYRIAFDSHSLPRAIYGFARNFLYLESFWTAPRWVILLKGLALLATGGWLVWHWRSNRTRFSDPACIILGSLLGFVLCQALLGVYFFGSDTERWVFLTPIVALALAAITDAWPAKQQQVCAICLLVLALVNLAQGIWPLATNHNAEERVVALSALVTEDTLVISTGNDWTSHYSFYVPGSKLDRISLMDLAVRHKDEHEAYFQELAERMQQAHRAGRRVLLIRVLDESDDLQETPWPELARYGYTPQQIRAWFRSYPWMAIQLSDPTNTWIHCLGLAAE